MRHFFYRDIRAGVSVKEEMPLSPRVLKMRFQLYAHLVPGLVFCLF